MNLLAPPSSIILQLAQENMKNAKIKGMREVAGEHPWDKLSHYFASE